jgi:hypothetical protein
MGCVGGVATSSQQWRWGTASILAKRLGANSTKLAITAPGSVGSPVHQATPQGTDSQKFAIQGIAGGGNGFYRITPGGTSSLVFEVPTARAGESGAPIVWGTWRGTANQLWKVEHVSSGYHRIVSSYSGKVIDVTGGSTTSGAKLVQWDWHGGDNQQ